MIERGIGHCTIVAPDDGSQSAGLDDLNCIERDHIIWRTRFDTWVYRGAVVGRRVAFVLVGKPHYFDIAQPKLPNQTFEHHESLWPLDSIVIEMGVSRKNDIDSYRRKLV